MRVSVLSMYDIRNILPSDNYLFVNEVLFLVLSLSRYWDLRQSNPAHVQQLPDRCYALTVKHPLMVVGTADRNLIVFNLQNPQVNNLNLISYIDL